MNIFITLMNIKNSLGSITSDSSSSELIKVAGIVLEEATKLEVELSFKEPVLMGFTNKEVTICLWRGKWIHHIIRGHVTINRCWSAQEIKDLKLDGPLTDDGSAYFIRVYCHDMDDYGIWISKDEAQILQKAIFDAHMEFNGFLQQSKSTITN